MVNGTLCRSRHLYSSPHQLPQKPPTVHVVVLPSACGGASSYNFCMKWKTPETEIKRFKRFEPQSLHRSDSYKANLDPESSRNLLISQNFSTKFPSLKLDQIRLWSQSTRVTSSQKPNVQNGLHFPDFQWRRDGYLKIEHFNPKKFCLKTYCRYPNCDGLSSCFKKQTAREHTSFSDTTVVKRSGKQFKWNCCSTLVTEKLQSQAATVVASVSEDLQKVTRKLLRLGGNKSQICHTGWSRMICMICLTNFKNTEKTQSKV
jgi:hypothetical protein